MGTGSVDQYSLGTRNSHVPSVSSGLDARSTRIPDGSVGAKYSGATSLGWPHRLQVILFPPLENTMKGLMYARHLLHLGGPTSPKSSTGTGCSPSPSFARGCNIKPRGSPVLLSCSLLPGMQFNVRRPYLGDALPWSRATNGVVAGGGTCFSMVGYT